MNLRNRVVLVAGLLVLSAVQAHEAETTIPVPGFRPESVAESEFLADVGSATIAVYPTLVRRIDRTAHSFSSREQVIAFLDSEAVGHAIRLHRRIDRGRMQPDSQWNIFQGGLAAVAETGAGRDVQADYFLALEILVPGDRSVFGIECYILDRAGRNAFSFLLNAHHRLFAEAGLEAGEAEAQREAMIGKATAVAMQALSAQIALARECGALESARTPLQPGSDVLADFEAGLPGGTDPEGIPLGFSTFHGEGSRVLVSTTTAHPPRPGEAAGNAVLKLELDVGTWAGVLQRFADDSGAQWAGYDWTGARELSFWLHGRGSGTALVFDLLDNRGRCSRRDDAERYSFRFVDDFEGWKLFSIPLEVMVRKEIGNDAPDDGLGLSMVHGWGLAALRTNGERTYFVDDVRLRRTPILESVPEGLSRERDIWVPINELPMFGGYEKTAQQKRADEHLLQTVLPEFDGDAMAAAEHFAREGWNLYYRGDHQAAIKRFNQAWLLDARNTHALWGFAVISRERGQMDAALRLYRQALDTGAKDARLRQEYEALRSAIEP